MKKTLASITAAIVATLLCTASYAQTDLGGGIRVDKTVHDFGDILISDGPVACTFTITNTGTKPVAIYSVATSCGCTDVKWTREPIAPGKTGTISVTYANEDGAYPFEKSVTAYFSSLKQPVVLRLKGVTRAKKLSLSETYPVKAGQVGFREAETKVGNLRQGQQKSGEATFANLGTGNATVSFTNVSPGLKLSVSPNPVGAGKTSKLTYTVTADRSRWGKNTYCATVSVNGKSTGRRLSFWAVTAENFASWTDQQKKDAALPDFTTSSFAMNTFKPGQQFDAVFEFTNEGKSDFRIYKIDSDWAKTTAPAEIPATPPGQKGSFKVHIDTTGMPAGETLVIISLTTNCPSRPLINLFVTGWAS